ncbi:MAG: MATE family efflux transporter [Deltaproteobacteria bacterium]|nr:MATE family efflux transporter [Deltaproteobacteria bacterium]
MSSRREALPWSNHPTRELARLAWPIAVSMVSYALMTLADTFFVARLGTSALAGVGFGGTAAFFLLCFSFGLLRGVQIRTSVAVGAGRREQAGSVLDAGVLLAGGMGALTLGLGLLLAEVVPSLMVSQGAALHARGYLLVRLLAAPLVLIAVALRQSRTGQGDVHHPMVAALLANGLNIALDALFILGLEWGPEGAAWASDIAALVEAAYLLRVALRAGWRPGTARWPVVRGVLSLGVPTGLHFLLEMGSFAALTALLARMPEVELAAHQIALQVTHFSFLPAAAVGEAASTLVGQAVGGHRDDLVRPLARRALLGASLYTGAWTLGFAFGAPLIVSVFTGEAELAGVAVRLLWVAAVFQVFDGANVVGRSALRGTGDVRVPAVVGVVTAWVLVPPLAWWLGLHLGFGALGGWLGLCVELILGAAVYWARVERGGWLASARRTRASVAERDPGEAVNVNVDVYVDLEGEPREAA